MSVCVLQGETGVVFYLTLDVVETNCSVLSRSDWKSCEARPDEDTPVRKHSLTHTLLHAHPSLNSDSVERSNLILYVQILWSSNSQIQANDRDYKM